MRTVKEILELFENLYPFDRALSYDNVGLIVGRGEKKVSKILLSLDVSLSVIEEAAREKADLIISHHPVIFREIKRVTDESYTGNLVLSLAEKNIAAIALHTNFDAAENGNNYLLARALGAKDFAVIDDGFATEFDLPAEWELSELKDFVKKSLSEKAIRSVGQGKVSKVIASCGAGASESLILRAKETGAVVVTSDVKHNLAEMAKDLGVRLIEPTHYAGEWAFNEEIKKILAVKAPETECVISRENTNPYNE